MDLPANLRAKIVVYDLPYPKDTEVGSTRIMIDPRHREGRLVAGSIVALREVVVPEHKSIIKTRE